MSDKHPTSERRPGRLARIGAAAIAVMVFLLIVAVGLPHLLRAIDIDSCLDAGGRWNAEEEKCEGARPEGGDQSNVR